jgi:hypothetical protein
MDAITSLRHRLSQLKTVIEPTHQAWPLSKNLIIKVCARNNAQIDPASVVSVAQLKASR